MSIIQPIENGKVVENTTTTSKNNTGSANAYDKEMFLQLLVAEMQYQDPLEPTSNTEYVSELASFTQIEAVQSVQDQMSTIEANSLVGKYVILLTNDGSGEPQYVSGKVDYVMKDEEGKMFLSVNDKLYSIDELDSVADEEYYMGVTNAQTFADMVSKMPNEVQLTLSDKDSVTAARNLFDSMSNYQKQFVSEDGVKKLETLEKRLEELQKAYDSNHDKDVETESEEAEGVTDTTEKTEDNSEV